MGSKYFIVLLFALIYFNKSQACPVDGHPKYFGELNKLLLSDDSKFNGTIIIYNDSIQHYIKYRGNSDFDTGKKNDYETQYVIGSISKQITAVLVLRKYEEEKIDLNQTVAYYLPNLKSTWKDSVTVHHLLSHTHGIVSNDLPLLFPSGSAFNYSQYGYHLLALILEQVSGKKFDVLCQELFEELNMRFAFHPNNKAYEHLAIGYEQYEDDSLSAVTNSLENYPAAGSFIASAIDLVGWNYELVHAKRVLKPATYELMTQSHSTRPHPFLGNLEYGYGLTFRKGEKDIMIGALGYAPGFVSASCYFPRTGTIAVILQNTAYHLPDYRKAFNYNLLVLEILKNNNI